MPYKDKQKQYEHNKASSRNLTIRFIKTTDADVISWIDEQERPTTAIKQVLRAYVEGQKRG